MNRRKKKIVRKRICKCFIIFVLLFITIIILKTFPKTANLEQGWNLILVNYEYRIPEDYEVELKEISDGKQVDARIYDSLSQMLYDGKAEGYHMVIVEAYRNEAEQQLLMDQKVEEYIRQGYPKLLAKRAAKSWVAVPGTSEHQLGIAVDINPDYEKSGREVYTWLANNAHNYGFIKRYPGDKIHITKIHSEPWHYRYVGKTIAKEIYEQGICLEEYLEK